MTRNELIRLIRRVKTRLMHGGMAGGCSCPWSRCASSHSVTVSGKSSSDPACGCGLETGPPRRHPPTPCRAPTGDAQAAMTLPPPGDQLSASIVIPVLNNAALTHGCLESIIRETSEGTYEVIVVDNGSDEATRQMLAGVTNLRVIRNETNVGFVGACNQGAAAARGRIRRLPQQRHDRAARLAGSDAPDIRARSSRGRRWRKARLSNRDDCRKRAASSGVTVTAGTTAATRIRTRRHSGTCATSTIVPAPAWRFGGRSSSASAASTRATRRRITRTSTWRFGCAKWAIASCISPPRESSTSRARRRARTLPAA